MKDKTYQQQLEIELSRTRQETNERLIMRAMLEVLEGRDATVTANKERASHEALLSELRARTLP